MSYRPLSREEADQMKKPPLLDDGEYPCSLVEFHHTDKYHNTLRDSNGELMTRIKLKIYDIDGKERFIFTHLFWGENNKMAYRTRHFAESFGVLHKYENGSLYDDFNECLGSMGHCEIYTQKERPKNDGSNEKWAAKNDIRDFFVPVNSFEKVESFVDDINF